MKKILALDIGGSFIKFGFFDKEVSFGKLKTPKSEKEFKEALKILIKKFNPSIVSLAIPYPYDEKKDKWHSPNLKFKFKLKKFISSISKAKVFVGNDANLAALAEAKIRGTNNLVLLTLGTGLGSGVIINGKIYRGKGYASEIGHSIIVKDGFTCGCGNKGCAEAYISIRALQRYYGGNIEIEEIARLAGKGDKKAKKAFNIFTDYLALLLSNIANIFNPQTIILAGGLTKFSNLFLKDTIKKFKKYSFKETHNVKIELSKLGDFVGVYGAYFYALEKLKEK